MAKSKKKKNISEKLTLNLFKVLPSELAKLAEDHGLEQYGIIPMPDGRGVAFGGGLQPEEYIGEGLPELGERNLVDQWNLNLDIRISCDHEGITYLEVARPGGGTFHRFEHDGVDYNKVLKAAGRFNNSFQTFFIYWGILFLFQALYWQEAAKPIRDDAYDAIMKSFANYFKSILKPKRRREVKKQEIVPGLTLTTYEEIESGREPRTETELEKEKEQFLEKVFAALEEIDAEGGKQTQLDVGLIIFGNSYSVDAESRIYYRCRQFGLKWKDILKEYRTRKKP